MHQNETELQPILDPETKSRARTLAEELQDSLLQRGESPQALRAALRLLLERIKEQVCYNQYYPSSSSRSW